MRLFTRLLPSAAQPASAVAALPSLPCSPCRCAVRRRPPPAVRPAGARQLRRPGGEAAAGGGEHLLQPDGAGAAATRRGPEMPLFPPGSPFEQFFKDFLNRNRPAAGAAEPPAARRSARMQSLGSGFIIDPSGLVVTNNHVIDGADEITVTLQDDTTLKAKVVGRDEPRRHRAAAGEAGQAAARGAVRRFRHGARRRLGAGDRQSVRPGRHGHRRHRLGARARHPARARTTTSSRPTRRSTAAIPAARCSTWTAR